MARPDTTTGFEAAANIQHRHVQDPRGLCRGNVCALPVVRRRLGGTRQTRTCRGLKKLCRSIPGSNRDPKVNVVQM
eukprot:358811-Chlamydomonas_euryale.AAC.5